jgi:hypothetical protein
VVLDGVDEMECVSSGEILDAKIVDTEDKSGLSGAVPPEAWSERHRFVTGRGKFFNELVEGDNGGLFEAVHTVSDFEIYIAISLDGDGVARIGPDFLRNDGRGDVDVLVIGHRSAKEIVLDVKSEVASAVFGMGDSAVDADFGIEHGNGWGADVARVIQFVAASCHGDSMGFFFLRTDGANKICIGDFAVCGDLSFPDEE